MQQSDLFPETLATQTLIHDDCLNAMRQMDDNSIDFCVTDPPYALTGKSGKGGFMGKQWDSQIPNIDIWKECLRICKPGAMMAAFGGSRTHHRLMCAIEDADFEIKDVIFFLHGSGFPKGLNIGKHVPEFDGYNTNLKPAYEPIILAMKNCDGTFINNAKKWGVAGINIDESRIGSDQITTQLRDRSAWHGNKFGNGGYEKPTGESEPRTGRFPANIILDEEAAQLLDQSTGFTVSKSNARHNKRNPSNCYNRGYKPNTKYGHDDAGGASRFFYTAKASTSERNRGMESCKNIHCCVKPISLMKYILKLLAPPGNPICLDLFMGSGTTGIACKQLNINFIGIEKELDYFNIAKKRISLT